MMQKNISFHLFISALVLLGALLVVSPRLNIFGAKSSATTFSEGVSNALLPVPVVATEVQKIGKPAQLIIPSINIDIAVTDGAYDENNKTWSLSNDKAHYALISPLANNIEGNTFIYGHNRKEVFSRLDRIKPGETATLITENNLEFTYTFQKSIVTQPYDDTLFYYKGAPILTLQTCSGLWYQDRSLYTFTLTSVTEVAQNAL